MSVEESCLFVNNYVVCSDKSAKQRFCGLFCSYLSKYQHSFSYKQKKKLYLQP